MLQPLFWVGVAVATHATVVHLLWRTHTRSPGNALEAGIARVAENPERARLLGAALRTAPLVLATWLHLVDPATFGLAAPSSSRGLAIALVFAAAAGSLMMATNVANARTNGSLQAVRFRPVPFRTGSAITLEAAGLESYWAFIRGAVLAVGLANGTFAVFAALGILALQAWTDPAKRIGLLEPDSATALSHGAVKAVLSTAVFLATGSLLVCWALHTIVAGLLWSGGIAADRSFDRTGEGETVSLEPTVV